MSYFKRFKFVLLNSKKHAWIIHMINKIILKDKFKFSLYSDVTVIAYDAMFMIITSFSGIC